MPITFDKAVDFLHDERLDKLAKNVLGEISGKQLLCYFDVQAERVWKDQDKEISTIHLRTTYPINSEKSQIKIPEVKVPTITCDYLGKDHALRFDVYLETNECEPSGPSLNESQRTQFEKILREYELSIKNKS